MTDFQYVPLKVTSTHLNKSMKDGISQCAKTINDPQSGHDQRTGALLNLSAMLRSFIAPDVTFDRAISSLSLGIALISPYYLLIQKGASLPMEEFEKYKRWLFKMQPVETYLKTACFDILKQVDVGCDDFDDIINGPEPMIQVASGVKNAGLITNA